MLDALPEPLSQDWDQDLCVSEPGSRACVLTGSMGWLSRPTFREGTDPSTGTPQLAAPRL